MTCSYTGGVVTLRGVVEKYGIVKMCGVATLWCSYTV